jgi:GNAT superfamily N-acetyltransferase
VESWDSAAIEAQASYYAFLASSSISETMQVGDGFAVASGIFSNTENGVVAGAASAEEIATTFARFQEWHMPAMWLRASALLRHQLVSSGARADVGGIDMGAALCRIELPALEVPDGIRIEPVRGVDQLSAVLSIMHVHGDHFREDGETQHAGQVFASLGLAEDSPLQHYLATDHGEPVGMATAYFTKDVVLLQHVIVAPSRRRRGLGRALVLARLADAVARGCTTAVLGPTPESEALYRPLGFTVTPGRESLLYLPLLERE